MLAKNHVIKAKYLTLERDYVSKTKLPDRWRLKGDRIRKQEKYEQEPLRLLTVEG